MIIPKNKMSKSLHILNDMDNVNLNLACLIALAKPLENVALKILISELTKCN